MNTKSFLAALGAILMWSFLAALAVKLAAVPPLLLNGAALTLGGIIALPKAKSLTWNWPYIIVGTLALFSYQILVFISLRTAPPVEVNLINYFWPLFIVLLAPLEATFFRGGKTQSKQETKPDRLLTGLAPLVDRNMRWKPVHLIGAFLGFSGGAIAILNQATISNVSWHLGYPLAFVGAIIWSCYSLSLKRLTPVSFWTMGVVCLFSGIISLGLSVGVGETIKLSQTEMIWLALLGFGPLGLSFYLWGYAMKNGDPGKIGTLAYLTPILSTAWLLLATGRNLDLSLAMALFLVIAGAAVSNRKYKYSHRFHRLFV